MAAQLGPTMLQSWRLRAIREVAERQPLCAAFSYAQAGQPYFHRRPLGKDAEYQH